MTIRERGARLLRALLKPFLRARAQGQTESVATPMSVPNAPPPLPPAHVKYVLYRCGDGAFDVFDGDQMVGDLFRQDGDRDRPTVWVATLYNAHFDWFKTLKAAKDWLGQPPVRRYRQSATHRLDMSGARAARERRGAPQK